MGTKNKKDGLGCFGSTIIWMWMIGFVLTVVLGLLYFAWRIGEVLFHH